MTELAGIFGIKSTAMAACLVAWMAGSNADAAVFTLSAPNGDTTTAYGQAFVPNQDEQPDSGLGAGDTAFLENFTFTSGGQGGAANTRLAIFNTAFFGFTVTGPQNADFTFPLEADISDALVLSTNTVDTASAADGDTLSFDFDSDALAADSAHSAIFVVEGVGGKIIPIGVSTKFVQFSETSPGVFAPATNLGGSGNFDFVSLFGDFSGDGFFAAGNNGEDLAFTATFNTVVPEPGAVSLLLVGLGLMVGRRRYLFDRKP